MALNFGSGSRPNAGASAQVKRWVREHLALDDATLVVSELACTEPGCPPIETVIAVLDVGHQQTWKLHKPLAEVDEADIVTLKAGSCASVDQDHS